MGKKIKTETAARQRWMGTLAKSDETALEAIWLTFDEKPTYQFLRKSETGLAMVEGRAGGTGARFNVGEMAVTRCAVTLTDGTLGISYVASRSHRHAELAAVLDALLQREPTGDLNDRVAALAAEQSTARQQVVQKAMATKVDFFTMVRGD